MDGSGNLGPPVNNFADLQVQGSENTNSYIMASVHSNSADQLDNFGNIDVADFQLDNFQPDDFIDYGECFADYEQPVDELPVDPQLPYSNYPYDSSQPDFVEEQPRQARRSLEQPQQQPQKSPLSAMCEFVQPQQSAQPDPDFSAVPRLSPAQLHQPVQYQQQVQAYPRLSAASPQVPAQSYQPAQYQQPVQTRRGFSAVPRLSPAQLHQPVQYQQPVKTQYGFSAPPNQDNEFYHPNPVPYGDAFDPNSYQPQCNYSEEGIKGNHAYEGPYMDSFNVNQTVRQPAYNMGYQPLANIPLQSSASPCVYCGYTAHMGPCLSAPLPGFPIPMFRGHALPQLQQQPQQQRPKRKFTYEDDDEIDDDDGEPPAKTAKTTKTISRRTTRASKGKRTTKNAGKKVYPYLPWGQVAPWVTKGGFQLEYLPAGQLEEHILFGAEDLRAYLKECPRTVTIWLQNSPSKCKGRQEDADMKCRYAGCPTKYGTILHGWHRVAFDEFPEQTSDGSKDPFKMAGVMHLWCFEQCIDPHQCFEEDQLLPDHRDLPHEATNRAAINRDDYKGVVPVIKKWGKKRQEVGVAPVPYPLHEDTLSWTLCNYHIQHQTNARESCRKKRNALRPDDERKTIEIIMGDLSKYVARDKLSKMRTKRRHEQAKGLDVVTPPPTAQRREPSRVQREPLREITSPVQRVAPPAEVSIQDPLENLHKQPDKAIRAHTSKSRVPSQAEETIFVRDDADQNVSAGQDVFSPSSLFGSPTAGAPEPELPSPGAQDRRRKRNSGSSSPGVPKQPRVQMVMPTSGAGRSPRASAADGQPSPLRRSSRVIEKRTP
ncbi:uncharacterized protein B0J16DRAFT_396520 [Fusarium flagelliforme]|uniref:Uncharacterized protein n=1 Tax=Fusarium flagelliforme TaxID=2675880 RepID=A0A395MZG2_9HYPO|nr:uncharacterized protein B0J16DRAFT_396520 [Fusarium flagelliforme]KAH7188300.1 hypothetical protein B0J16DRAFT_396520 [Fusarium flagelliforme]RFN52893.1 hypothetical protein FIE12Z_2817 [Fusarium flagelliforme]